MPLVQMYFTDWFIGNELTIFHRLLGQETKLKGVPDVIKCKVQLKVQMSLSFNSFNVI